MSSLPHGNFIPTLCPPTSLYLSSSPVMISRFNHPIHYLLLITNPSLLSPAASIVAARRRNGYPSIINPVISAKPHRHSDSHSVLPRSTHLSTPNSNNSSSTTFSDSLHPASLVNSAQLTNNAPHRAVALTFNPRHRVPPRPVVYVCHQTLST